MLSGYNTSMRHRNLIIRLFQFFEVSLVVFALFLFTRSLSNPGFFATALDLGPYFGRIALLFLILTLLPGISRRLRVALFLNKYLMPFRRHLGINTYLFALSHSFLTYTLPLVYTNNFPPSFFPTPSILSGILAITLITPLFATSNDYSVRLLKQKWGQLHRLVYPAAFFVALHLLLQSSLYALAAGTIVVLEIVSYLIYFRRKNGPKL